MPEMLEWSDARGRTVRSSDLLCARRAQGRHHAEDVVIEPDWDSPSWPAVIMAALIVAFVLYVMWDAVTPEPMPHVTVPPAVYVVETLP